MSVSKRATSGAKRKATLLLFSVAVLMAGGAAAARGQSALDGKAAPAGERERGQLASDTPQPDLVERIAKRFLDAEGDLKELAAALASAPQAWNAPRDKLKKPGEWIVAALRATGVTPPDIRPVLQAQNLLGEPLWRPPAPKGFPDDSAPWLDGLSERLDIANQLARRVAPLVDPESAVELALGPLATDETRQTVARREPASGARAPADGAGIPTQMKSVNKSPSSRPSAALRRGSRRPSSRN